MNNIFTNWTKATTNISSALISLISCLESNKNAWIEIRKNGEQEYPIMKKIPNWIILLTGQ